MKTAVVMKKGGPLVIAERPVPDPGPGEVRIKVYACGVCHSDQFIVDAIWPGLALPRVPGHEVAGVVEAVGLDARSFTPGQRVGVGCMEVTARSAPLAVKGTSSSAIIRALRASRMTAATRNT